MFLNEEKSQHFLLRIEKIWLVKKVRFFLSKTARIFEFKTDTSHPYLKLKLRVKFQCDQFLIRWKLLKLLLELLLSPSMREAIINMGCFSLSLQTRLLSTFLWDIQNGQNLILTECRKLVGLYIQLKDYLEYFT